MRDLGRETEKERERDRQAERDRGDREGERRGERQRRREGARDLGRDRGRKKGRDRDRGRKTEKREGTLNVPFQVGKCLCVPLSQLMTSCRQMKMCSCRARRADGSWTGQDMIFINWNINHKTVCSEADKNVTSTETPACPVDYPVIRLYDGVSQLLQ